MLCGGYVVWLFAFYWLLARHVPQVYVESGGIRFTDFFYYQRLASAVWFEDRPSPYLLGEGLRMLSHIYGTPIREAMPIGAWPTFLLVLVPFSAIGRSSAELAYGVWMGSSLFLLAFALVRAGAATMVRDLDLALFAAIVLASDAFLQGVLLGQTSIGACAMLLWLQDFASPEGEGTWPPIVAASLAMLALSFKPPYLIMGAATLISFRAWRSLAASLALVSAATGLVSIRLGAHWPSNYLAMMASYSGSNVIAEYRNGISVATMNVFRFAYEDRLGAYGARLVSLGLLATAATAWSGATVRSLHRPFSDATARWLSCSAIAILLLFTPYSGAYEDLLVVPVLALAMKGVRPSFPVVVGLAIGLFLVLDSAVLHPPVSREILWAAKATFLCALIVLASRERSRR